MSSRDQEGYGGPVLPSPKGKPCPHCVALFNDADRPEGTRFEMAFDAYDETGHFPSCENVPSPTKPSTFEELLDAFRLAVIGRPFNAELAARSALVSAYKELEAQRFSNSSSCINCGYGASEHDAVQGYCFHGGIGEDATSYEPTKTEIQRLRSRISELEANALTENEADYILANTDGFPEEINDKLIGVVERASALRRSISSKREQV